MRLDMMSANRLLKQAHAQRFSPEFSIRLGIPPTSTKSKETFLERDTITAVRKEAL